MRTRVVTALVLLFLVILAFAIPHSYGVLGLCTIAAGLAGLELAELIKVGRAHVLFSILCVSALCWLALQAGFNVGWLLAAFAICLALFGFLVNRVPKWSVPFALIWIAAPLTVLAFSHRQLGNSIWLALLPVWAGDVAAIFVGRAWGKHPLAPSISPKKTIEGAIGSAIASIAMGAALAPALGIPVATGFLCGLACTIFGQAGDLYESYIKRQANVKDSGSLLPGHGGILDRIDALLFAAIPVVLCLQYVWPR